MFEWSPSCQQAFEKLNSYTVLVTSVFPDFTKRFILGTDASGVGLGAVLSQKQSSGQIAPIRNASRTLH